VCAFQRRIATLTNSNTVRQERRRCVWRYTQTDNKLREIFDNSLAVQRALQRGVNTPGNAATNLWNVACRE